MSYMIEKKALPLALIIVALASLLILGAPAQPPMPPCWFYGTVSVEGSPAQDNLNITVAIGGTNLTWATKTRNGTYGWTAMGSSSFYIPSDDPTTPNKDGGANGDIIEFYVDGVKTNATEIFEHLSLKRVDLAVGPAPCWFYGNVSVDGLPAQDNLNITAVIRGTNLNWETVTKNGTYGWTAMGSSSFYIPGDNLTSPNKDGGVDGDMVDFYVSGAKTNQSTVFEASSSKRVDLAVDFTPKDEDNGGNWLTSNLYLWFAAVGIIIVVSAVLWIHRKGYRIKVLKNKEAPNLTHALQFLKLSQTTSSSIATPSNRT